MCEFFIYITETIFLRSVTIIIENEDYAGGEHNWTISLYDQSNNTLCESKILEYDTSFYN